MEKYIYTVKVSLNVDVVGLGDKYHPELSEHETMTDFVDEAIREIMDGAGSIRSIDETNVQVIDLEVEVERSG